MADDPIKTIESLTSQLSSLSGRMSAIHGWLNDISVPQMGQTHRRVKLLTIMYQQLKLENERLIEMARAEGGEEVRA